MSLVCFQLSLGVLMQHRQSQLAKKVFAFTVPVTVVAFVLGHLLMPNAILLTGLDGYEIVSLIFSTMGVAIYNWFDEKQEVQNRISKSEG
jgi:UDP-N-acetylmuramyl pentapeptide phosphotransferase/UDP-N-acetylglucosamine-1-phosphate transferase